MAAAGLVLSTTGANPVRAQVVRAFSSRFSVNQSGDIRIVGNTVETCSTTGTNGGSCLGARAGGNFNNNDFTMLMVDVDGNATTFNSSTADLAMPVGASALFAGLYWGGDVSAGAGGAAAPNAAARNQVVFTRPDLSSSTVTASQLDVSGNIYQGFADVTALVQANGAGTYTVANVQSGTGNNHYAGWSLVVVYQDPGEPIRNLTVNDGFAVVSGANPNVSTTISGFLTPATGPVRSRLGAVVYEGDLSSTGDALRLNGTPLSDALNPAANPYNSTIGRLGTRITAKSPDYVNQLGFDIDVIDATGILGNSANSATMSFATGGETFFPGVVTIATELYAPVIAGNVLKSVTDVDGGSLLPGDTLQYAVAVSNTGEDGAVDIMLIDTIPANSTYVPGSLEVTAGANAGAKSDASGDDQAEFDGAGNQIRFRLGTGATGAAGGSLAPSETTTARFRVVVAGSAQSGTAIDNRAEVDYDAQTLGTSSTATSTVTSSVVTLPDLTIALSHTGDFSQGQAGSYLVTVSNPGNLASSGTVTVTDTLPAGLAPTSAAGTGWSCSIAAQVVSCTRSDPLAAGVAYPAITLGLDAAPDAASSLVNRAHVDGGGEVNNANNSASDPSTVLGAPDAAIAISHAGGFNIGQHGTFTITVTNEGSAATTGATTVTDVLPAGLTFVSGSGTGWSCSAAGQTVTCAHAGALAPSSASTITLVVSVDAGAPASITNSVSVSTAGDSDPSNDSATDAPVPIGGPADLAMAVSHTGTFVVGHPEAYTLTVTNIGAAATTGTITVTDVLPAGLGFTSGTGTGWSCGAVGQTVTCTNASILAPGAAATITLAVTVAPAALPSVTNTASVSTSGDVNPANDSASDVTAVTVATLDLTVATTHADDFVVGGEGAYTVTVTSVGNRPTTGPVTVTDTLPAGLTFVSGAGAGWTCSAAGQIVTCSHPGMLAAGDTTSLVLTVAVGQAGVPSVTHTVTVATTGDANSTNDSASESTTVIGAVDLAIAKRHTGTFTVGANALYTIVVTNVGQSPTSGDVTVTDDLPAGLGFVSGSGGGWICGAVGSLVSCTHAGSIAAGDSAAIALAVSVDAVAMPSVTNSASVTTPGDPSTGGNNTVTDVPADVSGEFALFAEKSASKTDAEIGDVVDYAVRVRSAGTSPVPAVAVEDRLPAGFAYQPGTARINGVLVTDPTGSPGPALSFDLGTIPSGVTVTVTYRAKIGAGARNGSSRNLAVARSGAVSAVSNVAVATVMIGRTGGAFDDRGTIAGSVRSRNGAGIPGVRIYLEDGTSAVTDQQGQYHFDGVSPRLHVVKVDRTTLPAGAMLEANGTRSAGDGYSRFVDLTNGELHRTDFLESSDSPAVRDEVARRRQESKDSIAGALPTVGWRDIDSSGAPAGGLTLEVLADSGAPAGANGARVRVALLDAAGSPRRGSEMITLEATQGQWIAPDENRTEPGNQVYLHDGAGEFTLRAPVQAARSEVRVTAGDVSRSAPVTFTQPTRPLVAAGLLEARLDLRSLSRDALAPARPEDGFEETLQSVDFQEGDVHGAVRGALVLKGKVRGDYLLTLAYDTEKDPNRTLFRDIQPDQFYPVYGDGSVREFDAQTSQRLYVRVDRGRSHLLYGDFTTTPADAARDLTRFDRSLTGATQHLEGARGTLDAFATRSHQSQLVDEIRGLGISGPYTLSRSDGRVNSEKVEIVTRDRNHPDLILSAVRQERFTDYEFEPFTGRLLFRAPVPSLDANLNPVSIRVSYEVENGGDAFWTYGLDGRYRLASRLQVGGSFARDDNPLSEFQVWGLNSTVELGGGSTLLGELGHTERDDVSGTAQRAEFRHQSSWVDLRVYGARSDSGFANSSSTLSGGRLELGLRGTGTIDERTRLLGEALRTEDRIGGGHREGASLAVERRLSRVFTGELGYRYGHETANPASPLTVGATPNETNAIRGRLTAEIPNAPARVFTEYEQDVAESDQHRGAVGGEYRIASRTRLYARHEWITSLAGPYALNGVQQLESTVFGVDADYYRANRAFSEYRVRDGFSGREVEAAIGLRNRWAFAEGWALNTSFERVSPLAGPGSGRATAVTGAVEYTGSPVWKGSGRLEYRGSPTGDNFLGTLGYARQLNQTVTLLGRSMWNLFGGDQWRERSQIGLAFRQAAAGRWTGLTRYEHRFERLDLGAGTHHHTASVVAGVLNFQARPDLSFSWRYAGKLATDELADLTTHSNAQLLMSRTMVDLSSRWDAGVIGSILVSDGFTSKRYGFGLEAGRLVMRNLRLAAGYNLFGFSDSDLTSAGYTSQGLYLDLGFKFDEALFKARGEP